jgi:hypothetical protein
MPARHVIRLGAVVVALLVGTGAFAQGNNADSVVHYLGFTVDMKAVADATNRAAVEASIKRQVDIVAGCGAAPRVLAFFRGQRVTLDPHAQDSGGGRYSVGGGVTIGAEPQPPENPVLLHELLHAFHHSVLPGGKRNQDVIRFYRIARGGYLYPARAYVLKDSSEFFAVTASLYLWGKVARPPHDRATLRAKQPHYYTWLGQLFGVKK